MVLVKGKKKKTCFVCIWFASLRFFNEIHLLIKRKKVCDSVRGVIWYYSVALCSFFFALSSLDVSYDSNALVVLQYLDVFHFEKGLNPRWSKVLLSVFWAVKFGLGVAGMDTDLSISWADVTLSGL
jgi:hypothetical protein